MDISRALARPFTDAKKLLIGFFFSLPIPLAEYVIGPMATGYEMMCYRTAADGEYKLPEWENYGTLWVRAFMLGLITIIYMIPAGIVLLVFGRDLIAA